MMAIILYKYVIAMIACFLLSKILKTKETVCIGIFHFVQI